MGMVLGASGARRFTAFPGRLKGFTLAVLSVLPLTAGAFAVGDAELQSLYAQPLNARVPVTLTQAGEAIQPSDISVRLLPQTAYEGMGLTPPPLNSEMVSVNVNGNGQTFWVELTSQQPVREPMMTLLLEVRVSGVRIVRELPFLFDPLPLAPDRPQPAASSAVAPAAALPAAAVVEASPAPVTAPAPLPVAVAPPTSLLTPEQEAKPARVIIRRPSKPRTERRIEKQEPELATFRLAGWNQTGLAPKALMPRFQLAPRFDSYIELAQAGAAPAPATMTAAATAAEPVVTAPAQPEMATASGEGGSSWLWWTLFAGGIAAVAMSLQRRRRKSEGVQVLSGGQKISVSDPVPVRTVAATSMQAPVVAPEPVAGVEPTAPVVTPSPAAKEPPVVIEQVAASASGPTVADLRKRQAELTARAGGDANLLRKAQLVAAYIDLNRLESAQTLLNELESDAGGAARPKFTLIKG